MPRALLHRVSGHRHLLTGSAALVVTAGVQALSGAVFWLIAARVDTQTDVGHATALLTSMLFVAFVGGLGQPVAAARYAAGRSRDDHILFAWGALVTSVASAVLALLYLVLVSPRAVDELRDWHGLWGPALFAFLCAGTALSLLLDVRLMTQRRWGIVIARSAGGRRAALRPAGLPSRRRKGCLAPRGGRNPHGHLRVRWHRAVPRITGGPHRLGPRPALAGAMIRYSLVNWASTLAYQAPTFAMPVIVLVNVGADLNASFYVAWGMAAMAAYVPMAIGQALLAEGGRDGAQLRSQVRLAIVAAGGLMVVGTVIATVGRGIVVSLYGEGYREASNILPMLVAASIPWAVTSVYLTEARVRHRSAATVSITVALSVAVLGAGLVLVPDRGLDGAAAAYLGGNIVAAIVALVAHLTGRSSSTTDAPEAETTAYSEAGTIGLAPLG